MIKIVHDNEVGLGLEIQGGMVQAKAGANVRVDASGINVDLPKSIAGIRVEGNEIVVTNTASEEQRVALPAQTVDVKLQGAEITSDNKLKLTLTDGSEIEADLAKFVDAPKTAEQYWTEIKALPTFKADLIALLKGEEVQDLAGATKGYLLASA